MKKEKIKIIIIRFLRMQRCNKNNQGFYKMEHTDHKSKSGRPVRLYPTSGTLFLMFVQQTCHIARITLQE